MKNPQNAHPSMNVVESLNSMFGTVAKPASKNRSTMPSGPLKDMGKILAKAAKMELKLMYGKPYTFIDGANHYSTMIKLATGKLINYPIYRNGRNTSALEMAMNGVIDAMYHAYKRNYITVDQIKEQFRIEDELMYTATGRVNKHRLAKRDVLIEVLQLIRMNY